VKELVKNILECKKCKIADDTKNKVVGKGSKEPKVLFVGLNPGVEENEAGVPFVGKSGKLLDKWIDYLGLKKSEVAIINLIKCYTPNAKGLEREYFENCLSFFHEQLDFLKPDIVIILGLDVYNFLFNSNDKMGDLIGEKFIYHDFKVLPFYHPSYFVRKGGYGWEEPLSKIKKHLTDDISFYAPLHVHTEYSVGDGSGRIEDNLAYAKSVGFESCAITDHGTIAGHWQHAKACEELGIKPIFGIEFYVINSYEEKNDKRYHLVALAKNLKGLLNLYKLNSIAHENFYYKPRIALDDVFKYKEGLVVTSACTLGVIGQKVIDGELEEAKMTMLQLKKEFGDDFYLEFQPHDFDHQHIINPLLAKWGRENNIKTIIATDVHYKNKASKKVHNAIKAIAFNKKYGEASFTGDTHCFLTPDELLKDAQKVKLNEEEIQEAMKNTLEVANKCKATIKPSKGIMPKFKRGE